MLFHASTNHSLLAVLVKSLQVDDLTCLLVCCMALKWIMLAGVWKQQIF